MSRRQSKKAAFAHRAKTARSRSFSESFRYTSGPIPLNCERMAPGVEYLVRAVVRGNTARVDYQASSKQEAKTHAERLTTAAPPTP